MDYLKAKNNIIMRRFLFLFAALLTSAFLWGQSPSGKTFSTLATMASVDSST